MNDPHDNAADDKAILAQLQLPADADVPDAPCNDPNIRGADDSGARFCLHWGFNAEQHKSKNGASSNAESLLHRLRAGEDLETLYQETLPPAERELLRRVALTRQFDEALVDEVLRPGVPGGSRAEVPFARLTEALSVDRWPRTNSYYMRDEGRQKWLRDVAPNALRDVEVALAAYWAHRGDEIERLYHLLAVDLPTARALFCALYAAADDQLDLPRCYDLICVLRERITLLDPELFQLFHEKEAHLRVRNEERYRRYHAACRPHINSDQDEV